MKSFFLLIILLGIIWRVIKWFNGPLPKLKESLPQQNLPANQPTDGLSFLIIATDAFIKKGRSLEEVKLLLKEKKLDETQIDIIANKAYELYQKWLNEQSEEERTTRVLKIKSLTDPLPHQKNDKVNPGIDLIELPTKNYDDSIASLTGIKHYSHTREFIQAMLAVSTIQQPILSNLFAAINEISFKDYGGSEKNVSLRTISLKGERQGFFPYFKTNISSPLQTNTIAEWQGKNSYNIEADIAGTIEEGVDIGFFATDYAVNQYIYKSQQSINIRLSAFAIFIKRWDLENGGVEVDQNYTGYFPNNEYEGLSCFDVTAMVLAVEDISLNVNNHGYLLKLKLLNGTNSNHPLIVDTFVNSDNVKIDILKADMTVEGLLWMHGEIAK